MSRVRVSSLTNVAVSPVVLGSGEHLFAGIDTPSLGYECTECVPTSRAMHVVLTKKSREAR
jgi:hypothetical protein